jgi:transcriptional regulator with XRE-family HTH domain
MSLDKYLTDNSIPPGDFAKRIGVSAQALYRYRTGQRVPEWAVLERIKEATGGTITNDDFLDLISSRKPRAGTKRPAKEAGVAR